jgi:hypothetical protein
LNFHDRPLGAIPSKPDPRDYPITRVTAVKAAFPESFKLQLPPDAPYDQNGYGMCVAFATDAAIKQMQEHKEDGTWTRFSAGYRYAKREPTDYLGEGMEPREALASLLKYGTPPHHTFPFLGTYPDLAARLAKPEFVTLDDLAYPQKIGTYVRLYNPNEVKTALMELGPVLLCIPVHDSFYEGGHLALPREGQAIRGYHAMVIYGWTEENRWLVLNSWGQDWGPLHGLCTMPFNYPITEMWSLTDLTPDPVPPAPEQPIEVPMYLKPMMFNFGPGYSLQFGAFGVKDNALKYADFLQAILEKGGATVRRTGF